MAATSDKKAARGARPPPLAYAFAELPRALFELACLVPGHAILSRAPKGDGHPVMTIPGYRSDDGAMRALRRYLGHWGYKAYPWGLGVNLGVGYQRLDYEARLVEKLERVVDRDGEPLSLIGWSQGGVIAREIAKDRPELVRQVITLGSPIADAPEATTLFRIFKRTSSEEMSSELMSFLREVSTPLPDVRCICIYSATDGIVSPEIARDLVSPNVENIRVNSSHLGMAVNPYVLFVIADRLAQVQDDWRPFNPNAFDWILRRSGRQKRKK
jgi:pimeloyl-ACP methyl ester carboxylesterase